MINIGINGFGRIGRAVFRIISQSDSMQVVHINDTNPSVDNLAYLLKYDSIYGKLKNTVKTNGSEIIFDNKRIKTSHNSKIYKTNWMESNVDIVIESSGIASNHKSAYKLIESGIRKVIITHSSDIVDKTIVFGVNENNYNSATDNVVSSSICDANAVAPILKLINDKYKIESGNITTLHPWLGYQNLTDGPCRSFAYPGELYENFSLGRASTESMIPKTTSCVDASLHVVPELTGKLISMSFRTPTPIVSSAILSLKLNKKTNIENVKDLLMKKVESQNFNVFSINTDPLISKDFIGDEFSVIVDHRWTDIDIDNTIRLILWYDNEWGYSSRVVDLIKIL